MLEPQGLPLGLPRWLEHFALTCLSGPLTSPGGPVEYNSHLTPSVAQVSGCDPVDEGHWTPPWDRAVLF